MSKVLCTKAAESLHKVLTAYKAGGDKWLKKMDNNEWCSWNNLFDIMLELQAEKEKIEKEL